VTELTAHRTLALRDALAGNPHVAMTALLHKLVTDTFQHRSTTGCLEASVRHVFFPVQADELKDSPSAKSVTERHEAWKTDIPSDDQALWDWISGLDETSRLALLAHCVSYVNALVEKGDRFGGSGLSRTASIGASPRPTVWCAPSASTWPKPAGSPPWATISVASPSPAFSPPSAKALASAPPSSSTI
jgi:hypothetical protein